MIALYLPSLLWNSTIVLSLNEILDSWRAITLSLITNLVLAPSNSTKSFAAETRTGWASGSGLVIVSFGYLWLKELTNSCSV